MAASSLAIDKRPLPGALISPSQHQWFQQLGYNPEQLAVVQQVHGKAIKRVEHPGEWGEADGLVSDHSDVLLGIRTADCAAIFMADPTIPAIGLFHVGWRGAQQGIVLQAIRQFHQYWRIAPEQLWVAVSPFLRSCCYRVTNEFQQYFPEAYFQHKKGKIFFRFESVLHDALITGGIPSSHITMSPWCTACGELPLHSYRRENTAQRMYHWIQIIENG